MSDRDSLPIAEALRHLRTRKKLKQVEAGALEGAPDFRTLSHWETARKEPSFRLLASYLAALDLTFHDLQDALDAVRGWHSGQRIDEVESLGGRVDQVEQLIERVAERLAGRVLELERRLGLPSGE